MKKFVLLVLITLGIVAGGAGFYLYKVAYRKNVKSNVRITLEQPVSFDTLSNYLYHQDVIQAPFELDVMLTVKKLKNKVLPKGTYNFKKEWTNKQLANQLVLMCNQKQAVRLTFGSVRTLEKLAGRVATVIHADSSELMAVFNDEAIHRKYGFNRHTFISLFIPNTYEVYSDITPEEFVAKMAKEYKKFWNEERKQKARELGLSQSEVTTLASIVYEEQKVIIEEQPKIAGLYLNRLKSGWLLQADPTVKYALNQPGLRRLLYKHLEVDSPYNTYLYKGLPPGPICIPEPKAIDAVLNCEQHDYYYMCAKPEYSGYHNFAKTNAQHEQNARLYHRWLKEQKIGVTDKK